MILARIIIALCAAVALYEASAQIGQHVAAPLYAAAEGLQVRP